MNSACSRTVRHRTLRETLSRTCGVRMSPALSRTLRHLGTACKSEFTTAGSLTPLKWSVEAGDHAGVTRTATMLQLSQRRWMETSFAACCGSEWRTRRIHVSLTLSVLCNYCCYGCCVEIFSGVWPKARLSLQIISLDQTIDTRGVAPSTVL